MEVKRFFAITGITMPAAILTMMLAGFSCFPFLLLLSAIPLVVCAVRFRKQLMRAFTVFLAVCVAVISFAARYVGVYQPSLAFSGQTLTVAGIAADYPINGRVILKKCTIGGVETKQKVTVYLSDDYGIEPGDRVKTGETEIRTTDDDGNVFLFHTLSGQAWLNCSTWYTSVETEKTGKTTPLTMIQKVRHNAQEKLNDFLTEESTAIASALITGDKSGIDDETTTAMRYAGISHIFAVSGMHLSIWSAVLFVLFGKAANNKKIPLIAASVFVVFYMLFTGLSPSVLRAGIMLLAVFTGGFIRRKADAVNSLGFAVTLLLIINPFLAGNVSFLLSSLATFAIVKLYPTLTGDRKKRKSTLTRKADNVIRGVVVSACVMLTTLPVCAVFFGYISLMSPVASLVCTPIAEGIMLTAATGLLLPASLGKIPFTLCEVLCRTMREVVGRFSRLTFAVCPIDKSIVIVWFIASLTAFILVYLFVKKAKRQALSLVLISSALCLVLTATIHTVATRNDYEVFIPDAGSNTSIAVTDRSGGTSLLIGAGGDYYSARDISSHLSANCITENVALIVPRDSKSENGNRKYICPLATEEFAADCGKVTIGNDGSFFWETTDSYSYGVLLLNGKRIVLCLYPSGDYRKTDLDGDILICRAFIPDGIDTTEYKQIIVMSNRTGDYLKLPDNAVTTKDTGGVNFTVRAD